MSELNYWNTMRRRRISRRTMLSASAKAGVGAAGLALVGCGDDDDDDAAAVAQVEEQAQAQAEQAEEQVEEQAQAEQAEQAVEEEEAEAQAEEQAQAVEEEEQAEEVEEEQEQAVSAVDTDATLTVAINRDAGGLDPLRAGSHTNYWPRSTFYEGGMKNEPETGDLISHLINTFETPDNVTYVLNVTDGIQWHDGTPYTAEDTAFTFERAGGVAEYHEGGETSDHPSGWATARATFGPPAAWDDHEVIDALTLRINVGRQSASMPGSSLSGAVPQVPKAYVERIGDAEFDRSPMGTGPFTYISDTDDTDFVAERNENYFRSRPGESGRPLNWEDSPATYLPWVKRLVALVRPEPLSAVAAVEAGEADIAIQLAPDLVTPFRDRDDFQVAFSTAGAGTAHQIMPNMHLAEWDGAPNPFLDIRVRQAANYAINRQAYIDNLLSGEETAYYGMFPGVFGYAGLEERLADDFRGYDPDKAKALMAEAGYADGFDTTFHLVTDFVPVISILALVIQQDLANIGIRTTIKEYPSSEYFVEIRKFEQPGLWWFFTNSIPEPETVLGSTVAQGFYNVSPLDDSRILDLYQAQEAELDPSARNVILQDLYAEAYQQAQFIYLHNSLEAVLMSSNVDWPIGRVQGYNQDFIYRVRKLRT